MGVGGNFRKGGQTRPCVGWDIWDPSKMCGNNRHAGSEGESCRQREQVGQEPAVSACVGRRPWGWGWAGEVEEQGRATARPLAMEILDPRRNIQRLKTSY